jgi:hypothetical protein
MMRLRQVQFTCLINIRMFARLELQRKTRLEIMKEKKNAHKESIAASRSAEQCNSNIDNSLLLHAGRSS